jgi:hypothetical protein
MPHLQIFSSIRSTFPLGKELSPTERVQDKYSYQKKEGDLQITQFSDSSQTPATAKGVGKK